jgi:hypothetical protein
MPKSPADSVRDQLNGPSGAWYAIEPSPRRGKGRAIIPG